MLDAHSVAKLPHQLEVGHGEEPANLCIPVVSPGVGPIAGHHLGLLHPS